MKLFLFVLSMLYSLPSQGQIHVDIEGLRSDRGEVRCALYNSAKGFPKDPAAAQSQTSTPVSDKHATCDFDHVAPGTYAIAVYHDENSNGKLDTNFLGIPREGVGASNDAKGHMGPPKFHDASFSFTGTSIHLVIHIQNL